LEEAGQERCWEADEWQKMETQPLAGFKQCAQGHGSEMSHNLLSYVITTQIQFTPITADRIPSIDQPSFQQNILQRLTICRVQLMLSLFEFQQNRVRPFTVGLFGTTNG
jgi:hypothetical protein